MTTSVRLLTDLLDVDSVVEDGVGGREGEAHLRHVPHGHGGGVGHLAAGQEAGGGPSQGLEGVAGEHLGVEVEVGGDGDDGGTELCWLPMATANDSGLQRTNKRSTSQSVGSSGGGESKQRA